VQQIIKASQETGFEKFVLRAKEDLPQRFQGG